MQNNILSNNIFIISLGAIPAALLRSQINDYFIVNIIGCFILGFVNSLNISRRYKLIFGFSFCGSFTTFSGWILHLFKLRSDGLWGQFILDILSITFISILAIYLGKLISEKLH